MPRFRIPNDHHMQPGSAPHFTPDFGSTHSHGPQHSSNFKEAHSSNMDTSFQSCDSNESTNFTGENSSSHRSSPSDANVTDTTDQCSKPSLYSILGVESSTSKSGLKKAYYKLCRVHHPDKGGDEDKFKELSHAFKLLSDDLQRSMYDLYGHAGIDGDFPWKTKPEDAVSSEQSDHHNDSRTASQQSDRTSRTASQESQQEQARGSAGLGSSNKRNMDSVPSASQRCTSFEDSDGDHDSDSSEVNFRRRGGADGGIDGSCRSSQGSDHGFRSHRTSGHNGRRSPGDSDDPLEQGDPTIMRLDCTLEEIYCGSTMQIVFSRKCVCDDCQGSGYSFKTLCNSPFCPRCNGTGKEIQTDKSMSILSNQFVQVPCSLCDGKGMLLKLADVCLKCVGDGFSSIYVSDEVSVPRGTKHGTRVLVSKGGGDSGTKKLII